MRRMALLFAAVALSLSATPLSARIIRVPLDHSTIQGAIEASADGDTVYVPYGTYYENIRFRGKAILVTTWLGGEGQRPPVVEVTIDGSYPANPDSAAAVYFVDGEDETSVIRGFTITHEAYRAGRGRANGEGIVCDHGSPTVTGNRIVGNSPHGIRYRDQGQEREIRIVGNEIRWNATPGFGGGIYIEQSVGPNGSNALVSSNVIAGNTAGAGGALAIRWGQGNRVVFEDNVIVDNTATAAAGIWTEKGHSDLFVEGNIFAGNSGAAIVVSDYDPGSFLRAVNNTIAGNADGILLEFGHEAIVKNNIIVGNGRGIARGYFQSFSSTYNDVWGNDVDYADCSPGEGDISEDPLFVGGVPFDYALTAASPCIDAGDPASPPDPDGTRADMGARYYHQSTGAGESPVASVALSAAPNPFRDAVGFSVDLDGLEGPLEITIHDIAGRLVRTLPVVRQGPAGVEVRWDGRAASGERISSGVYFCRLVAGGAEATTSIVRID
jgi:parallel beta-helix repeat protein